jgi:hypothetical protein
MKQLTIILAFIISTAFSVCAHTTGIKEAIKLMQGKWIHTNDSLSSISINNYQWTFEHQEKEVDSEDIYIIAFKENLPEFVNKTVKGEFLILTNKSDTLQYEILGISDTTFSLMYFPSGKIHRYRRSVTVRELNETVFFITNESMYSPTFLSEFKARHSVYDTVSLINDTIIVNNDTVGHIIIPTDLPLNKKVTYEELEKDKKHILTVKRINYSTIEYVYFEEVNGQQTNLRKGTADLEPVFYFGAEGIFEDENENIYGMNEYIDNSEKDCCINIYIGVGSIEKSQLKQGCETNRNKMNTGLLTRTK